MVDLCIALVKQVFNRYRFQRIGAASVLFLPEKIFQQILSRGLSLAKFPDLLHNALILRGVRVHFLFESAAFLEILCHFACKLNVYECRAASALADDRIDDFYRLRYRAANYRARYRLQVFRRDVQEPGPAFCVVRLEVVPRRGAGVVILHALLKIGDKLVTGLYGEMAEL